MQGEKKFRKQSEEHSRDFYDHNLTLNRMWNEMYPVGVPPWITCDNDDEVEKEYERYRKEQMKKMEELMTIWNNTFYGEQKGDDYD